MKICSPQLGCFQVEQPGQFLLSVRISISGLYTYKGKNFILSVAIEFVSGKPSFEQFNRSVIEQMANMKGSLLLVCSLFALIYMVKALSQENPEHHDLAVDRVMSTGRHMQVPYFGSIKQLKSADWNKVSSLQRPVFSRLLTNILLNPDDRILWLFYGFLLSAYQ